MMNFVRYAEDGTITSAGYMDKEAILIEVNNGARILTTELSDGVDWRAFKVDPSTLELVKADPIQEEPQPKDHTPPQIKPITDKQFYVKAAFRGMISQDDALKAVQTGFIPAPMQAYIDTIQEPDIRFAATMLFAGETTIYFQHPLIQGFFMDQGMDAEAMEQFFQEATSL